jgi:hypothetical protein
MSFERYRKMKHPIRNHRKHRSTISHIIPDDQDKDLNSLLRIWEAPQLPPNDLAQVLADYDSFITNQQETHRLRAGLQWCSILLSHRKALWGTSGLLFLVALIITVTIYEKGPRVSQVSDEHMQEILSDVNRKLKQEVPSALEPGLYLASEFITRAREH